MIGSVLQPQASRTNFYPMHRDFSAAHGLVSILISSVDDFCKANWACITISRPTNMATPYKFGSVMLSRVVSPSTCLRARPFSTSLAFRAANDNPFVRRSNPLVGNFTRAPKPEPARAPAPETPKSFRPKSQEQTPAPNAFSDIPPPPPPAAEEAQASTEKSAEEHPYTAAKSAASMPFNLDIASLVASKAGRFGRSIESDILTRPQVRAKPVTGRTVFVKERNSPTSGSTPMSALRVLNRMVREQQVKNKFHSQRFHERKGLKKKRLRSERWRARFKTGFVAAVHRVNELKKQGW